MKGAASISTARDLLADLGLRPKGVAAFEEFGAGDDDSWAELEIEFLAVLDPSGEQVIGDQVEWRDLVPGAAEFYVVRLHFVAVAADGDLFRAVPGEVERRRGMADFSIAD